MQLDVCEIFYSLQGESTYAGLPCIFIRLAGCNLNCSWCDTAYAREEYLTMTVEEILRKVETYNCRLVELTGGEPLIQAAAPFLINELIKEDYTVLLETNGSRTIADIHPECIRVVDVKCPSSGESQSFLMENLLYLSKKDEIKFVIADRRDYDFAADFINENLSNISPGKIHLSPVWDAIAPEIVADWMIDDDLHARLSIQQHKIIWDPDTRGV